MERARHDEAKWGFSQLFFDACEGNDDNDDDDDDNNNNNNNLTYICK
jgi:hypothetical protein